MTTGDVHKYAIREVMDSWGSVTMFHSSFTLLMPRPTIIISEREPAGAARKLTGKTPIPSRKP